MPRMLPSYLLSIFIALVLTTCVSNADELEPTQSTPVRRPATFSGAARVTYPGDNPCESEGVAILRLLDDETNSCELQVTFRKMVVNAEGRCTSDGEEHILEAHGKANQIDCMITLCGMSGGYLGGGNIAYNQIETRPSKVSCQWAGSRIPPEWIMLSALKRESP